VPYEPVYSLAIHTPFLVSPNEEGANAKPSTKLNSDKYPSKNPESKPAPNSPIVLFAP